MNDTEQLLFIPDVMQPQELPQNYLALAPQKDTQANRRQHRLTFVNDNKQEIRKLNCDNAAKHRRAIFTGMSINVYLDSVLIIVQRPSAST